MPHMTQMPSTNARTELSAFKHPQVLLTLLTGAVGFGGMFAVYTYISWTMTQRAGLNIEWMWVVLMAYGLGLSDRSVEFTVTLALSAIAICLVAFYFTSANAIAGTINFGLIGMFGSVLVPALQVRLMDTAGEAQTLAAALNHSALNFANAGGAALGGAVIAHGFSYSAPALVGAALSVVALGIFIPTAKAAAK